MPGWRGIDDRVSPVGGIDGAPPWSVEIADTGVGMDQEALAKMFEPYFSTKATGTGLGLTIAKRKWRFDRRNDRGRERRGVGTRSG